MDRTPAPADATDRTGADVPDEAHPADRVAAAVLAVPGVAELHAGLLGEVGTYLPGRRVAGIRLADAGGAEVHVVLRADAALAPVVTAVRAAVAPLAGRPVHIVVEDVVDIEDAVSEEAAS